MAVTRRFTIGPTWVQIASGRDIGVVVDVKASAPIVLAVTVGHKPEPPNLPSGTGHRVEASESVPLVGVQRLWASAPAPAQVTVT